MGSPSGDGSDRTLLAMRFRIPARVVYRSFAAETVVLNLDTEAYHGLNPTAGRMLAALDGRRTVAEAAQTVADEYARPRGDVEDDICALCTQLLERGLIEPSDADGC